MSTPTLSRLRALGAFLALCALFATGTAAAQTDDPEVGQEADTQMEDAASADSAVESGDPADRADAGQTKQKNKKKEAAEPECVPEPGDADGGKAKGDTADGGKKQGKGGDSEEGGCTPPPRCDEGHVDMAPEEDEPNCVDQARLNRLINEFEAAAAEEAAALDELATALEELGVLNDQLDALRGRLGEVQLRFSAAQADAGFAAIRHEVAGESLDDVAAALASEEEQLRSQAVEAYMGGDGVELATAAAILEIDDYASLETAREYASVVIGDQLITVDHIEALRAAVGALADVVAAVEDVAIADAERVAQIEEQVDVLLVEQRAMVAEAEAEAALVAERIGEIQARKQAYADELRIQGAGGGAIGEMLRTTQAVQEPPEVGAGLLAMPLERTRLGSPFGPRIHPIFADTRLHSGIDMSGNSGDGILAAADGVVVIAEETGGYGNVVVVDHGNTIATLYAHMTADAVFAGQQVVEGELLGFVGSTGYSTGPHLHFEVRVNGTPVDPMLYLRFE